MARRLLFGDLSIVKSVRPRELRRKEKKASQRGQDLQTDKIIALRRQINDLVANEALPMVDATIELVKSGQYQALRYLFEMAGLYPATDEGASPEDSLAKILLHHLGISDARDPALETQSGSVSSQPDTVE